VKSNSYHLSILFKSKVEKEREKVMGGTSSQNGLVGGGYQERKMVKKIQLLPWVGWVG